MKRIVSPKRWSQFNAVEHPPLMLKQLVQGVCGGLRWLETKSMATYIAQRAVLDGFPSTLLQRKALGVQRGQRLSTPLPSSSAALVAANALPPILTTSKSRLITYDVLDCSLGSGCHAGAILETGGPYSRVVALDCDPGSATSAKELTEAFGPRRFRFFCKPMSEALAMFGERSFDAIMIDPGPSFTQLEDPERGFLWHDENCHELDLRYGPCRGLGALQYLNTVPQHALARALASYRLLSPEQSMKMARAVRRGRPFEHSKQLLRFLEAGDNGELSEDGWVTQEGYRKTSISWKFMSSLRGVVNSELYELTEAVRNAFLLLRNEGRLVVFSRLPWEEELLASAIQSHPHALLCYTECIDLDQVQRYGHTRHTKMWVASRVKGSAHVIKNTVALCNEDVEESAIRWMSGLFAGQTRGFPAQNFTFENMDARERRRKLHNELPPPFDYDTEDDNRRHWRDHGDGHA